MTAAWPYSYGSAFNRVQGGVYATLVENQSIRIWHWPRFAIPRDVAAGRPRPATWGRPMGDMSERRGGCNVQRNFHTMTIVSDLFISSS